jgi:hypothetical protein
MKKSLKDCTNIITNAIINDVFKSIKINDYLIEYSYKKEDTNIFSETETIKIKTTKLYEELNNLYDLVKSKKYNNQRAYFAYGMHNIDMYFSDNNKIFNIVYSPSDGIYDYIQFDIKEFVKLLNILK